MTFSFMLGRKHGDVPHEMWSGWSGWIPGYVENHFPFSGRWWVVGVILHNLLIGVVFLLNCLHDGCSQDGDGDVPLVSALCNLRFLQ